MNKRYEIEAYIQIRIDDVSYGEDAAEAISNLVKDINAGGNMYVHEITEITAKKTD